jgi:glucose/arabinose dehydrogenase
LWAVVNERDELGPNLVPDYLTSVKDGGFYGWPYSYYGNHVDPRVHPQRPDLVQKAIVPDYALSSHVAPLGLAFATGAGLLDRYRGGAFVANMAVGTGPSSTATRLFSCHSLTGIRAARLRTLSRASWIPARPAADRSGWPSTIQAAC